MKKWIFLIFLFFNSKGYTQNVFKDPTFSDIDTNYYSCKDCLYLSAFRGITLSCLDGIMPAFILNSPTMVYHKCQASVAPHITPGIGLPQTVEGLGYLAYYYSVLPQVQFQGVMSHRLNDTLESQIDYCGCLKARLHPYSNWVVHDLYLYPSDDYFYSSDTIYKSLPTHPNLKHIDFSNLNKTEWDYFEYKFTAVGGEHYINFIHPGTQRTITDVFPKSNWGNNIFKEGYAVALIDAFYLFKCSDTLFTVHLGEDTLLCGSGQSLTLAPYTMGFNLEDTSYTYLWSTGDTLPSITVNQTGDYWVAVTINHRYTQYDTIRVTIAPDIALQLPNQDTACQGRGYQIPLQGQQGVWYQWSHGDTVPNPWVHSTDTYEVFAYNECFDTTASILVRFLNCTSPPEPNVYIPNAFTPNGDGLNDEWVVYNLPAGSEITLFDRWGGVVYQNADFNGRWNGEVNGKPLPVGTYTFLLRIYMGPDLPPKSVRGQVYLSR